MNDLETSVGVYTQRSRQPLVHLTCRVLDFASKMAELPVPPMSQPEGSGSATSGKPRLFLLDYGAGNVRR